MSTEKEQQLQELKEKIGKPRIIFAMGGPGAGKQDYAEQLVEELGYTHLCTGDLLRTEMMKVSLKLTLIFHNAREPKKEIESKS